MSDVNSIFDGAGDFLNSINERHVLSAEGAKEEAEKAVSSELEDLTDDSPKSEEEGAPPWVQRMAEPFEEVEGKKSEGEGEEEPPSTAMDGEEIRNLSKAVVDFVQLGKDWMNDYFSSRFGKLIKDAFGEDKRDEVALCALADQEGKLSIDGLANIVEKVSKHTKRYEAVDFAELLTTYEQYAAIKKRYKATEIRQYQKEGIELYARKSMEKYMGSFAPDPLIMLGIYLFLVFGADLVNVFLAHREMKQIQQKQIA